MNLEEIRQREYPPIPAEIADEIMALANCPEWVTREMLDEYHTHWVLGDCPGCQDHGWFTWGLVHGAGYCGRTGCGWPGRLYHFLPEPGTKPEDEDYYLRRFRWVGLLWAHPKEVELG